MYCVRQVVKTPTIILNNPVCVYTRVCVSVSVYIYTYICIYMCVYIYIYTHTHTLLGNDVIAAVSSKITVYWELTPCSLVVRHIRDFINFNEGEQLARPKLEGRITLK